MDLDRMTQEVHKLMKWRKQIESQPKMGGALPSDSAGFADAFAQFDTRLNDLEKRLNELTAVVGNPKDPTPITIDGSMTKAEQPSEHSSEA